MTSDPIVDEVRAVRDALARQYDYDIDKLAQAIKADEAKNPEGVRTLAPKPALTVPRAS